MDAQVNERSLTAHLARAEAIDARPSHEAVRDAADGVVLPFEPYMLLSAARAEGSLVPEIRYVLLPNPRPPSIEGHIFADNTGPLADLSLAEQAADLTFADIGWLARLSGVPVLVKGVLRADDAHACLAAGAAGVIVSNHGGRQLDGAVPTALALPAVAAEVGGAAAVFADGGLRTGEDVLAALGLGARAVFLGRPVLWALACGGADGVRDLLTGLTSDLAHVMTLAGAPTVAAALGVTRAPAAHSLDT